jgi:hypothetical protein
MLCQLHDAKDVEGKINFSLHVIKPWRCMTKWRYRSTHSWHVIKETRSRSVAAPTASKCLYHCSELWSVVVEPVTTLRFAVSAMALDGSVRRYTLQLLYSYRKSSGTHWTRRWEGPRTNHYILKTFLLWTLRFLHLYTLTSHFPYLWQRNCALQSMLSSTVCDSRHM